MLPGRAQAISLKSLDEEIRQGTGPGRAGAAGPWANTRARGPAPLLCQPQGIDCPRAAPLSPCHGDPVLCPAGAPIGTKIPSVLFFFPSFLLFWCFSFSKPAAPSLPGVVNHLADENSCDNGGAARRVPPRREPMARLDNGVASLTPRGADTERRWRGQRRAPGLCSLGPPGSTRRSPRASPWGGTAWALARPRSLLRRFEDRAIWLNLGLSGLVSCVDGATCGWLSPFGDAACVLGLGGIPKATRFPFLFRYFPCALRVYVGKTFLFLLTPGVVGHLGEEHGDMNPAGHPRVTLCPHKLGHSHSQQHPKSCTGCGHKSIRRPSATSTGLSTTGSPALAQPRAAFLGGRGRMRPAAACPVAGPALFLSPRLERFSLYQRLCVFSAGD